LGQTTCRVGQACRGHALILRLQWLPKAIANRDAQIAYIANDNPLAAIMQGDLIAKQAGQLIQQPGMGRLGRQRDTRELVISKTPFIVIFRVKADRIEIIRLLHSSQQWKSSPGP
jgi:toxin ParE1/3/4